MKPEPESFYIWKATNEKSDMLNYAIYDSSGVEFIAGLNSVGGLENLTSSYSKSGYNIVVGKTPSGKDRPLRPELRGRLDF